MAPMKGRRAPPPTLQATVNAEAQKWSTLWNSRGTVSAPIFPSEVPALPRITPEVVRRASAAFGQRTGVGGDHLHPRWFAHLSDVSLSRVAFLSVSFEALGLVPS